MEYAVHVTKKAEQDLVEAIDYIDHVLRNPQAADRLLDSAEEEIGKLAFMPKKHKLADDSVLASWGIRFIAVGGYLAFYIVDDDREVVHIVRFLHGRRNWASLLNSGPVSFL